MAATRTRILLLGGHGKVSLLMTPKLISRGWDVISMIRNPEQTSDILSAAAAAVTGKAAPGNIEVLVESLEDIKSPTDAQKILDKVRPNWVVWSAGAGGKGGAQRTYAIDRDACIHFIRSAVATPSVSKVLLVSAMNERRGRPTWWDDATWAHVQKMNTEIMPDYYKAKMAADEALTVLGDERLQRDGKDSFSYIILRPGILTDEKESGLVDLGKTLTGNVTRADVADVAARLLEVGGVSGWIDLINGKEPARDAVQRVAKEGIDARDGEKISVMKANMA